MRGCGAAAQRPVCPQDRELRRGADPAGMGESEGPLRRGAPQDRGGPDQRRAGRHYQDRKSVV